MYGLPPLMDRYGLGLPPMGHGMMVSLMLELLGFTSQLSYSMYLVWNVGKSSYNYFQNVVSF